MRCHAQSTMRKFNRHWQSGGSKRHRYIHVVREPYILNDYYTTSPTSNFYNSGWVIQLTHPAFIGSYQGENLTLEIDAIEEIQTSLPVSEYQLYSNLGNINPTPDAQYNLHIEYTVPRIMTLSTIRATSARLGAYATGGNEFEAGTHYKCVAYVSYWYEIGV